MIADGLFNFGAKILDKFVADPQQRDAAKLALLQANQAGELKELEEAAQNIRAEATSPDKWVSRARPTFLYVMYIIFGACFLGAILSVWFPTETKTAADNLGYFFDALPEELYWLFGSGYLGYSAARSYDKRNGKAWRNPDA